MPATLRAALAASLRLALLIGPCAADNAFLLWLKNCATSAISKTEEQNHSEPLKVFSVGMSRTGTMTMQAALSELGYKTWHGNLLDGPYSNALGHAYKTGDSSWYLNMLSKDGFNASAEMMFFPVVRDALARYPEARVILTVRDSADKWVDSMLEAYRVGREMSYGPLPIALKIAEGWGNGTESFYTMWCGNMVWMRGGASTNPADAVEECGSYDAVKKSQFWNVFFNDLEKPETRDILVAFYERMNADLRKEVPREQLLEFNVKQGYGPLCRFLGVAEGDCPPTFPHVNVAGEMKTVGMVFWALRYLWWVPVLLLLLCVGWLRTARTSQKRIAQKSD